MKVRWSAPAIYSTIVSTSRIFNNQSLRTGGKVPVSKGASGELSYIDVGVSFDFVFPAAVGNSLTLVLVADVSYIPTGGSAPVSLPLRIPTTVFSSDEVSSRHKLQLEVTATPITP